MNEIRRPIGEADEIAAIRAVVSRHEPPEFVDGFTVELGIYENEPAAWIVFRRMGDADLTVDELRSRAQRMTPFVAAIQDDLLRQHEHRFPFFRSISVDRASTDA